MRHYGGDRMTASGYILNWLAVICFRKYFHNYIVLRWVGQMASYQPTILYKKDYFRKGGQRRGKKTWHALLQEELNEKICGEPSGYETQEQDTGRKQAKKKQTQASAALIRGSPFFVFFHFFKENDVQGRVVVKNAGMLFFRQFVTHICSLSKEGDL